MSSCSEQEGHVYRLGQLLRVFTPVEFPRCMILCYMPWDMSLEKLLIIYHFLWQSLISCHLWAARSRVVFRLQNFCSKTLYHLHPLGREAVFSSCEWGLTALTNGPAALHRVRVDDKAWATGNCLDTPLADQHFPNSSNISKCVSCDRAPIPRCSPLALQCSVSTLVHPLYFPSSLHIFTSSSPDKPLQFNIQKLEIPSLWFSPVTGCELFIASVEVHISPPFILMT